ncbi:Coiled-coil domain-containing protein 178 [Trichoplax sp. H2]|nr:Coiled-coil domain-containing protein 178 [Trichoplax sp. H2]|eukprot:RDD47773.1 Coiled-coil domain-containing protein 178 [Trichoplax sp. H2]
MAMLATEFSDDRTGYFQVGAIGDIPKPEANDWYRGSPRLFIYSRQSGIQSGATNERSSKITLSRVDDEEIDETEDQIGPLPEDWAIKFYNKEHRRRSCELSKSKSPCIRKVIEHLQQLESKLIEAKPDDDHAITDTNTVSQTNDLESNANENDASERSISNLSSHTDDRSSRQIRFSSAATSRTTATESGMDSSSSIISSLKPHDQHQGGRAALEIVGIGASMPGKYCERSGDAKEKFSLEEIIDEVLTLLGRLEADRNRNRKALNQQIKTVKSLNNEIEKLTKKRLTELPKAVQKEHETCALDIMELRWHNSYQERKLERLKDRVLKAEDMNSRMKDELSFCKESYPLVERKLQLEKLAIINIRAEQEIASEELNKVLVKLEDARARRNEAQTRVDKERETIKAEKNKIEEELRKVEKNYDKCIKQQLKNTQVIDSMRKKVEENKHEFTELELKLERLINTEQKQNVKIDVINDQLVDCSKERSSLENEVKDLQNLYEKGRMDGETEVARAEYQNRKIIKTTETTKKKKLQLMSEIESLKKQIHKLSKETDRCRKDIERYKSDLVKVDQQINFCMSEVRILQLDNDDKIGRLQREEDRVASAEDSLKNTAETLRKQLQDETRAKTLLQARITADTAELAKSETDYKRREERATRKAKGLDDALIVIGDQVGKSDDMLSKRKAILNEVERKLAEVLQKLNAEEIAYQNKLDELEPVEVQLKADVFNQQKKLDRLKWSLDVINQRLEDVESSSHMIEKTIIKSLPKNAELKAQLEDLNRTLNTEGLIRDSLNQEIDNINDRLQTLTDRHEAIMKERTNVLDNKNSELSSKLEGNKTLSHQYRLLQKEWMESKSNMIEILDSTVALEKSLGDHEQIKELQSMLTASLQQYYHIRGISSKGNLVSMNHLSLINSDRLANLRKEMQYFITGINSYLKDNEVETQRIIRQAFLTAAGFNSIDEIPADQRFDIAT